MSKLLRVQCGDWIYPFRDSISGTKYPIDTHLVAMIFYGEDQKEGEDIKAVSQRPDISSHLNSGRHLNFELLKGDKIKLVSLGNDAEPMFSAELGNTIEYDPGELARKNHIWRSGVCPASLSEKADMMQWGPSIFFASVILQAHLIKVKLPDGIHFRDATLQEIESIGGWPR